MWTVNLSHSKRVQQEKKKKERRKTQTQNSNMDPNPHLGSVWIGLILLKLKTYCWNHCSKIIFKCVNNAVWPIFNEKIDKKWNLWVCEQYTNALFTEKWSKVAATVHVPYMNSVACWGKGVKKKKRKKKEKTQET